jgi:hypothetical protein
MFLLLHTKSLPPRTEMSSIHKHHKHFSYTSLRENYIIIPLLCL